MTALVLLVTGGFLLTLAIVLGAIGWRHGVWFGRAGWLCLWVSAFLVGAAIFTSRQG